MSRFDYMRIIVFFDLPVKTKKEKKAYNLFRTYLIKKGFIMMQYSVYCRLLYNRDQASHVQDSIRKNVPDKGNVRLMLVTETQYSKIEVIIGGTSNKEELLKIDPFLKL